MEQKANDANLQQSTLEEIQSLISELSWSKDPNITGVAFGLYGQLLEQFHRITDSEVINMINCAQTILNYERCNDINQITFEEIEELCDNDNLTDEEKVKQIKSKFTPEFIKTPNIDDEDIKKEIYESIRKSIPQTMLEEDFTIIGLNWFIKEYLKNNKSQTSPIKPTNQKKQ